MTQPNSKRDDQTVWCWHFFADHPAADAELPKRPIDGLDIGPLISGQSNAKSPHEAFYFYWGQHLQAVRSGNWKLSADASNRQFT